ncbi:hypothetical protein SAMN05446935_7556 [Burkholderia sp. YR290]|nr:hypothetical protein SAMN05446935_7556 [Burkholderia sp. YR290]
MGGPATDPFANLRAHLDARKADYIRRLTTDEVTFQLDPVKNGAAKRRGFRRNPDPNQPPGLRPTCSLQDQDAAGAAAANNLALWSDTPCLRAGVEDLWDAEGINLVICRLIQFTDPAKFEQNLVVPNEPPDEKRTDLRFRDLLLLLRQLGVTSHGGFRGMIRAYLSMVHDDHPDWPDGNHSPTFPATLVEQVCETFQLDGDPDLSDKAGQDDLISLLAPLRIEGTSGPIGADNARDVTDGLYAVLRRDLVRGLVESAVANGRPGPYVRIYRPGEYEPPPNSYEKPPNTYEPPPNTYEKPPSSYEPPPSTYESPNPPPPPPRGQDVLFASAWNALYALSQLGRFQLDKITVRQSALWTARWIFAGISGPIDEGPFERPDTQLIQAIFGDRWTPPGFVWPEYSRVGIYWWRGVIKHHLTEHIFPLEDTSDFHTTDLIRFLNLFQPDDSRIPRYVRADVLLGLQWFKYWLDEPAATKGDGSERDEMTFWSENHQIGFGSSQVLAGKLLRSNEFPRSGTSPVTGQARTGQDHVREGLARVERWLDHRLQFGFSEWNAPGYYNEDFPPLFNLVDFLDANDSAAADEDERTSQRRVKAKAAMVIDVLIFDLARYTCRGSFGVTAGRAYWEHKAYGWEQSVGNLIEVLFATRGDYDGAENTAISFATSTYDVPEALLAIGLDRVVLDRGTPLIDRTRVSINFDEAPNWKIGFESEEDALFWWANEAYFDHQIETTKSVVEAHDNLWKTAPFNLLYPLADNWLKEFVVDLVSMALDELQVAGGVALSVVLPFPLNIAFIAVDGKNIIEGFVNFFKDLWDALKTLANAILNFLGIGGDDGRPDIPDTTIQKVLEELLVTFNKGTVLTRANNYCYCNGDAMLTSSQNHLPGLTAFQKHPWQATLGLDACVWTTARFMSPDAGSFIAGGARFLGDLAQLKVPKAVGELVAPTALELFTDGNPFGHDGPNYWTGSLALPMIVQHENAAIIAYSIPDEQRNFSGAKTHAWFPKAMFDETNKEDASDGTWFFGRKDSIDARDGARLGSGYVALFSARKADWTNESGNAWNDKEIMTSGASNIWLCVVGNEHAYGSFESFRTQILNSHLNVSGVGSLNPLECSFDIPGAKCPPGTAPRLELFYSDRIGRFAGEDLELDNFPRFENRYIQQVTTTQRGASGIHPQVEGLSFSNSVAFGSRAYTIVHAPTGLTLEHDLDASTRSHTSQSDALGMVKQKAPRLQDGNLTTVRRLRLGTRAAAHVVQPTRPNRRRFS